MSHLAVKRQTHHRLTQGRFYKSSCQGWHQGCGAHFKSIQKTLAAVLCMSGLHCWALGCYTADSLSLFFRCRTTMHPSSSSCLQWLDLSERAISYLISLCQYLIIDNVACDALHFGYWAQTFSPLSDLTAPSSVANRTHTVTPGSCWGRQRCFLHYHHHHQCNQWSHFLHYYLVFGNKNPVGVSVFLGHPLRAIKVT